MIAVSFVVKGWGVEWTPSWIDPDNYEAIAGKPFRLFGWKDDLIGCSVTASRKQTKDGTAIWLIDVPNTDVV